MNFIEHASLSLHNQKFPHTLKFFSVGVLLFFIIVLQCVSVISAWRNNYGMVTLSKYALEKGLITLGFDINTKGIGENSEIDSKLPADLIKVEINFAKALDIYPNKYNLMVNQARIKIISGNYLVAVQMLNNNVFNKINNDLIYQSLIYLNYYLGREEKYLKALKQYESLAKYSVKDELLEQAQHLFMSGDKDRGLERLLLITTLYPCFGEAHLILGDKYVGDMNFQLAQISFQRALDCGNLPIAKKYYAKGQISALQQEIDVAITLMREAAKLDPDNYQYKYQLGTLLDKSGKSDEARDIFVNAIALKPDNFWSYYHLVRILLRQNDFTGAIKIYILAQENSYRDDKVAIGLLTLHGEILQAQGNISEAIDIYQEILRKDSKNENAIMSIDKLRKK